MSTHLIRSILAIIAILFMPNISQASPKSLTSLTPVTAMNFRLTDHLGKSHELYRLHDANAIVLVTVGNGCPIVRLSLPYLNRLHKEFQNQGVEFLLLNANMQDDRQAIYEESKTYGNKLSILVDETQLIAQQFHLTRTATALVIEPKTWKILYRGAIHDGLDYGAKKPTIKHHWLREAIIACANQQIPKVTQTKIKGCIITYQPLPKDVSYEKDIAPLIRDKCMNCHTKGNIAPFSFKSHKSVSGWAEMINEVILTKRMPPWHADSKSGEFSNDRSLTNDQIRTIYSWINNGSKISPTDNDPIAEHYKNQMLHQTKWALGKPDLILKARSHMVPAEGLVDYQYSRARFPIKKDTWIKGVDVVPGNRKVVHHCLVFIRYPEHLEELQPDSQGGLNGYFASYLPGSPPNLLPEETGLFVPAGSSFIFQMHYTTIGRKVKDQTQMGLYFYDNKPKYQMQIKGVATPEIEIPPYNNEWVIRESKILESDSSLWFLSPHMHFRGKWFKYEAIYPNKKRETLLSINNYVFDWQAPYVFKQPISLPRGTRIICTGAYDNSIRNPLNPDPSQTVKFGEQSFEEMFIGYYGITEKKNFAKN